MIRSVILLSGGMDSATVLALARHAGEDCYALSFDYGQKHNAELVAAKTIASQLQATEHRIINIDSEFGVELADRCESSVVEVSTRVDREATDRPFVFARSVIADDRGSLIRFETSWGEVEFEIQMPGDFNVENVALVLALLLRHGIPLSEAGSVLSLVSAPPGRMQRVEATSDIPLPSVFIDFAHTPDGLEKALHAIRLHCEGELWCVFGCGGDRDRGKRPQMGEVASRLADHVIVTSDNPRTENAKAIIDDILVGVIAESTVVEDRAAAIAHAINSCNDNATILIAGKGHELTQIIGKESVPFSDFDVAVASLETRSRRSAG